MSNADVEQAIRNRKRKELAKQVQDQLSDFVNKYGYPKQEFIEAFQSDHRTLQQSQMRLFLEIIETVAELPDTRIDLRNKAMRDTCRKMVELYTEEIGYKPSESLPFI